MKKPNSAIDYTPRKFIPSPQRYVVFDGPVAKQSYPLYDVVAGGKSVQWTNKRIEAHEAFHKSQTLPKTLCTVYADGRRVLLDAVTATGRQIEFA